VADRRAGAWASAKNKNRLLFTYTQYQSALHARYEQTFPLFGGNCNEILLLDYRENF